MLVICTYIASQPRAYSYENLTPVNYPTTVYVIAGQKYPQIPVCIQFTHKPTKMDSSRTDWLRNSFYAAFVVAFLTALYHSFDKLFAWNTAEAPESKALPALLFPSVTICPYTKADNEQFVETFLRADEANRTLAEHVLTFQHFHEIDGE